MYYLYLQRVNHDLHQHLLIRKQTVQIQTLTLYSLQNTKNGSVHNNAHKIKI